MAAIVDPILVRKSDADLLSEIGMAQHFPEEAQAAFREFHRRHAGYLFTRLMKWIGECEIRSEVLDGEQLASEALEKAYRNASRYAERSGGDEELGRNQARAWLWRIVTNLALSALRSPSTQIGQLTQPDESSLEDVGAEPLPTVSTATATRVDAAMRSLNEVDQDILYTCLAYRAFGDQADTLPHEVRKELLAKYGLAEATFRQRKSRALKRLRELLS